VAKPLFFQIERLAFQTYNFRQLQCDKICQFDQMCERFSVKLHENVISTHVNELPVSSKWTKANKHRKYAQNKAGSTFFLRSSPIRKDNWRNARKVYEHSGKPRSE